MSECFRDATCYIVYNGVYGPAKSGSCQYGESTIGIIDRDQRSSLAKLICCERNAEITTYAVFSSTLRGN